MSTTKHWHDLRSKHERPPSGRPCSAFYFNWDCKYQDDSLLRAIKLLFRKLDTNNYSRYDKNYMMSFVIIYLNVENYSFCNYSTIPIVIQTA